MTKPLGSMTQIEQIRTIERRLKEKRGGLGFWSAVDADRKIKAAAVRKK